MEYAKKVLLLSFTYVPIAIISWYKALDLVISRNKAEILVEYNQKETSVFNPAVIRLNVKTPDMYKLWNQIKFSKRLILLRDQYLCGYCNRQLSNRTATIDHILPKSRGGKNEFSNCVTSCAPCNRKKDNRTPLEAGMYLTKAIKAPSYIDMFIGQAPEWNSYIH
jgi:5-methylcytosine-specific restriction endonuclease McrA